MRIKSTFCFLCVTFSLALHGSVIYSQTLLIKNARLIDGSGAAPVVDINIVVKGEHIISVGDKVNEADGMLVIDAANLTVMPGLVDMHTHPTFEVRMKNPKLPFPNPDAMPSSDSEMRNFIETRLPDRLYKFLEGGITTVVSAGSYWPFEIKIRERIALDDLAGPRLLVASPLFTAPGGHPASGICSMKTWCVKKLSFEVDNAKHAREGVRRFAADGAQGIKLVYDSFDKRHVGGPDFDFPRLDKEVMAAIVDEAKIVGLPAIAHTKTVAETADAVRAGVDALVHTALMDKPEFTSPDGEYMPQMVNEHGLSITTTIRSFYERLLSAPTEARERMQRNFDLVGPTLRAYADAGVALMFGTDFDGAGLDPDPAEAVRSEARALLAAGFTELEVIKMATGNAWKHPMVPKALGSIEEGKIADLLILENDPLKDITAITRPLVVIKEGRIVIDKR
jgi:enamidase